MKNFEIAKEILNKFPLGNLYLVGGSVRDYLLTGDFHDFDFATPLLPKDVIKILNIQEYDNFSLKFGTVKAKYLGVEIEITTFREEGNYTDSRHPSSVDFITDIKIDSNRRDFSINALYLDKDGNVIDYHNGRKDLKEGIIRMIGDPYKRLKEDPVRILRALRFSLEFSFKIDEELDQAIKKTKNELEKVSEYRLKSEIGKMLEHSSLKEIKDIFKRYEINLDF